jgi:hypothetical protein
MMLKATRPLTYMLTRSYINTWVAGGELFPVIPRMAGDPIGRTLLVSKEINSFLTGPWEDHVAERKAGRLRTDLEQFVMDAQITICMVPRKAVAAYMAILEPVKDGVWDIRSRDPDPAVRIIGCFSETDVFVGLVWDYRKNLITEEHWEKIIHRCQSRWRALFPAIQPFTGGHVHDYVSHNFLLEGN